MDGMVMGVLCMLEFGCGNQEVSSSVPSYPAQMDKV